MFHLSFLTSIFNMRATLPYDVWLLVFEEVLHEQAAGDKRKLLRGLCTLSRALLPVGYVNSVTAKVVTLYSVCCF